MLGKQRTSSTMPTTSVTDPTDLFLGMFTDRPMFSMGNALAATVASQFSSCSAGITAGNGNRKMGSWTHGVGDGEQGDPGARLSKLLSRPEVQRFPGSCFIIYSNIQDGLTRSPWRSWRTRVQGPATLGAPAVTPVHLYCSTCSKTHGLIVSIRFAQVIKRCFHYCSLPTRTLHQERRELAARGHGLRHPALPAGGQAKVQWASGKGSSSGG